MYVVHILPNNIWYHLINHLKETSAVDQRMNLGVGADRIRQTNAIGRSKTTPPTIMHSQPVFDEGDLRADSESPRASSSATISFLNWFVMISKSTHMSRQHLPIFQPVPNSRDSALLRFSETPALTAVERVLHSMRISCMCEDVPVSTEIYWRYSINNIRGWFPNIPATPG